MPATATSREDERRRARTPAVARDFLRSTTGWHVVERGKGGTVAHRGVLHPDEYVDRAVLVPTLERLLGYTVDELRWVYRLGRQTAAQRMLREAIDARLLRIREEGGNMAALAFATGVGSHAVDNAVARARQRKEAT